MTMNYVKLNVILQFYLVEFKEFLFSDSPDSIIAVFPLYVVTTILE